MAQRRTRRREEKVARGAAEAPRRTRGGRSETSRRDRTSEPSTRSGGARSILTHVIAGGVGVFLGLAIGLVAGGSSSEDPAGTPPVDTTPPNGAVGSGSSPNTAPAEGDLVQVMRVKDGDTIHVRFADGTEDDVRYLGINTPEKHKDYWAAEALEYNRSMVDGKEVRLVYDLKKTGDLGRILAYVQVGETNVNLELLRRGHAKIYRSSDFDQLKMASEFERVEAEAKRAGRGMWNETARRRWESSWQREDHYLCSPNKVHRPSCRHASESGDRYGTIEEAMEGREACSVCKPTHNHPTLSE